MIASLNSPPEISFCILSGGRRRDKVLHQIQTIRALNVPKYEILIGGIVFPEINDVEFVPLAEEARSGKTSVIRNRMVDKASGRIVVVADDDIVYHPDFYLGLQQFGPDFDFLCARMLNPDGTRCWDWATIGSSRGHKLLSYDETDPKIYISSGIIIARREAFVDVRFSEDLGYYEAEDVDFSRRIQDKGYRIQSCKYSTVTHDDDRYTQIDDYTVRLVNFRDWEPLAPGISGRGLYPFDGKGWWTASEAELQIELLPNSAQLLNFHLMSPNFEHIDVSAFKVRFEWPQGITPPLEFTAEKPNRYIELEVPSGIGTYQFRIHVEPCVPAVLAFNQRDRRVIGMSLEKPAAIPTVLEGVPPHNQSTLPKGPLDSNSIGIFAPILTSGAFAHYCRELARNVHRLKVPFGAETYAVDSPIVQLLGVNEERRKEWREILSHHSFGGTSILAASPDPFDPTYMKRWRHHRAKRYDTQAVLLNDVTGALTQETINQLREFNFVLTLSNTSKENLLSCGLSQEQVFLLKTPLNSERFVPAKTSLPDARFAFGMTVETLDEDLKQLLISFSKTFRTEEQIFLCLLIDASPREAVKIGEDIFNWSNDNLSRNTRLKITLDFDSVFNREKFLIMLDCLIAWTGSTLEIVQAANMRKKALVPMRLKQHESSISCPTECYFDLAQDSISKALRAALSANSCIYTELPNCITLDQLLK